MSAKNINQLDLFVANLIDVAPKGDQTSMEVPIFSLNKNKDTDQFVWKGKNGSKVIVTPNKYGRATIWDKDILIYLFGQIAAEINRGGTPGRTVRATAYDILVSTGRDVGGKDYKSLEAALRRLRGTAIETNIKTEGLKSKREFSIIQDWGTVEKSKDGNMVAVEITLSEWLYQAVTSLDVLTYDREYYRLSSGMEKRLYEIFRKHCGKQNSWKIGEEALFVKSGSRGDIRNFRRFLKSRSNRSESDPNLFQGKILGYRFDYDIKDKKVVVYPHRTLV